MLALLPTSPANSTCQIHCLPACLRACLQLQLEVEGLRAALGEEQEAVKAVEGAPGRARHQADLATAALRQMREEEAEVVAQLRTHEVAELAVLQVGNGRSKPAALSKLTKRPAPLLAADALGSRRGTLSSTSSMSPTCRCQYRHRC
jgi:hypothetical protein